MDMNIMIHELRTPMALIKSYAEILAKQPDLSEEKRNAYIGKIYAKCIDSEQLFLSMSTLLKSNETLDESTFMPFNLNMLMEDCLDDFAIIFENKNLNVTCSTTARKITCNMHQISIAGVIQNLMQNAVKYTEEAGRIHMESRIVDGNAILSIENDSTKMPDKECAQIFERYYRAEANTLIKDSYGLGLWICHNIITAHKGKIWAESLEDGTFKVSFSIPSDL